MFPRLSSSCSSLAFVCDRCSEPILPKEESILTVGKCFFHRNCFFCNQKQCGRALSLAEYGVHQSEVFCANCFVSLFSVQRDVSIFYQSQKSDGGCNGNAIEKKKVEKAIVAQHYERQLRTVQLGDEEGHGEEQQETLSGRSSDWSDCVGSEDGERSGRSSPTFGRGGRFGQLLTSPIPEVEEEADSPSAASSVACSSPCPPQPSASPPATVLRFFPPRVPLESARRSALSVRRASVCKRCLQRAFEAEKLIAAGEVWHKRCFRCLRCGRSLEPGKFSDRDGEIFCNNCYAKQFGPKGVGCGIGAGILQMHQ
ncbi:hypothetical protein niasHS_002419 [Heterodera schachtii]|uniref:LIM zinc-binding domain-containing protein n=1 Tax=Heterodera schachtii TaxID=97005 RepID=A0ABD2KJX0_HETSC